MCVGDCDGLCLLSCNPAAVVGADGKKSKKKKKGVYQVKKVKRADRPEGAESDSDSDVERENLDAFWAGKHVPCERRGLVIEKCTLTKKEAERRVRPWAVASCFASTLLCSCQ